MLTPGGPVGTCVRHHFFPGVVRDSQIVLGSIAAGATEEEAQVNEECNVSVTRLHDTRSTVSVVTADVQSNGVKVRGGISSSPGGVGTIQGVSYQSKVLHYGVSVDRWG